MRVPNAERAVIAAEKIRDYLLNTAHRRGGSKARLLLGFGYRAAEWERLADDLRNQHLVLDTAAESMNEYGRRFEIAGPIRTPCGRAVLFVSVWQVDRGTEVPRLITMYPG